MTDAEVEELRTSLARALAAADEERRRIERHLHDGAQQHLVALAVNAQLARELAETDPKGALELLEEVGRDARAALEAVRELASGIFPPLLADRGLAEALRAEATAHGAPADIDDLARQPSAFEAAAYFCVADALVAFGRIVRLGAREKGGALHLELRGELEPEPHALHGVRDRVAALGGRLEVGGSVMTATLPLPR